MEQSPSLRNPIFQQKIEVLFHQWGTPQKAGANSPFFSRSPRSDYSTKARQAQALGNSVRVARKLATTSPTIGNSNKKDSAAESKRCQTRSQAQGARAFAVRKPAPKMVAITNSCTPSRSWSTNLSTGTSVAFNTHKAALLPTPEIKTAPVDPF